MVSVCNSSRDNPLEENRLIILAALDLEAAAARRAVAPGGCGSIPVIRTIGMRAIRLVEVVKTLELSPADRVWLIGLAGALAPQLKVGDLIIDSEAGVHHAFSVKLGRSAEPPRVRVISGRVHTSDHLVSTVEEKQALFQATGALAVDMEQQIVRDALRPLGVSVIAIRAISDSASTPLNPILPKLVGPTGRPKWGAMTAALIRRPSIVPSLIRLGQDSSRACRSLTVVLSEMIS